MAHSEGQLSKFIAIFAGGTMISRVLGLVRDSMVNALIPVGPREAFLVAFRLPNTLRDIVGEGASNAAIIPVLSEVHEKRSKEEFRAVVASVFGGMILVLSLVTIAGVLLVPWMLAQINHLNTITGREQPYSPEELKQLASMGRWIFPYIFFIGLAVFSMGVLFTVGRYSTSSWAPALLNLAMIGSCFLTFHKVMSAEYALVLGVWVGGIAQVAVQHYSMGRHTGVWWPSFRLNRSEILTILALMGPVAIGQAAGEVNKLVDSLFAYSDKGAVTALYSANRLVQLPLSVFGFATAAAVLPAVSRAAAQQRPDQIRALLMHGLRQTYFLVLPSMVGLIVLGKPIVRLLFEYGHFTPVDSEWTANALIIYSIGLLAFSGVKVSVAGFYAVKDTKTPVIISSGSMILCIALCALLVKPFGYKGLASATTISYFANFTVLYILLSQRYTRMWDAKFISGLIRMSLATAAMAAIAFGIYLKLADTVPDDRYVKYAVTLSGVLGERTAEFLTVVFARAVVAGVPIGAAVLSYFLLSKFFGVDEFDSFMKLLKRKKEAKAKAK